jgi:hypothetical protein
MMAAAEALHLMRTHLADQTRRCTVIKRRREHGGFLGWFKTYLGHYITRPFSYMHRDFAINVTHQLQTHRGSHVCRLAHRGSSKSSFFTLALPIYNACLGTEPYIMLCADTMPQARKYLASVKDELETNERLIEDYPHACGKGVEWTKNMIVTRNGICIEALGAGNSIRGRRHGSRRPSLIVIDDPENDRSKFSTTTREHKRDWFFNGVMKAGDADTNVVVIGTPLHKECLVSTLLKTPGWDKKIFRAFFKWPVRMDLWEQWEAIYSSVEADSEARADEFYREHEAEMIDGASVAWPELYSVLALMKMRAMGHASFEQEMQCNPIDYALCEWGGMFDGDDLWFDDFPPRKDWAYSVIALDPSKGKDAKRGDYQAIVFLVVGKDGLFYVDCDMRRRPVRQLVTDMVSYCADMRPDVCVVESNQFQECIVNECEDEAVRRNLMTPIVPLECGGVNKIVRIRRLDPYVTRRRFRFKRRSPGARMLVEQASVVPTGDHDDGPDALEMAMRKAGMMLNSVNAGESVEDPS